MARHDHEARFYRDHQPVPTTANCVHNGDRQHTRFGDVVCAACHEPVGWHPDLVRDGLYGAVCDEHDAACDCGTTEYRAERLATIDPWTLAIGEQYVRGMFPTF